jgi:hypothetical protein
MSPDTERVPVPTNGRRPRPAAADAKDAAAEEAAADAAEDAQAEIDNFETAGADAIDFDDDDETSDAEFIVAFSPKQIAVGFGILASLLLLLVGARRRRKG